MRSILLIIFSMLLAQGVAGIYPDAKFFVLVTSIVVLVLVPSGITNFRVEFFRSKINSWAYENDFYVGNNLKQLYFCKGKLAWRTSTVQLVFLLKVKKEKYWFSCGNWWLGVCSNKVRIYKEKEGKILVHEVI